MEVWTSCSCSTRADQTVTDWLEVLDEIRSLGLTPHRLQGRRRTAGCARGARTRRIKAARRDQLHGGREHVARGVPALGARRARDRRRSPARRHAGRGGARDPRRQRGRSTCRSPAGRSITRRSSAARAADVEADCRRFRGARLRRRRSARVSRDRGRSARARARGARAATDGVCWSPAASARREQIRALAAAGADAFTVGSAAFDGSFAPRVGLAALAAESRPRCLQVIRAIRSLCCSPGAIRDPETGELLARRGALGRDRATRSTAARPSWSRRSTSARGLAVVSDDDTHARARRARRARARVAVRRAAIVLDRAPHADAETVARLVAARRRRAPTRSSRSARARSTICARWSRSARGCPQVVFATAPSMNGYTSLQRVDHRGRHQALGPRGDAGRRVLRSRACSPRRRSA